MNEERETSLLPLLNDSHYQVVEEGEAPLLINDSQEQQIASTSGDDLNAMEKEKKVKG
ncbi:unnamed protein product [Larinioides sclopetarius]|uniref:Uncharacterized protein n=1 Tax=Larinioides sclopetarius TaxID=280406 RepID=A0AAV2BP38_9ARAC